MVLSSSDLSTKFLSKLIAFQIKLYTDLINTGIHINAILRIILLFHIDCFLDWEWFQSLIIVDSYN